MHPQLDYASPLTEPPSTSNNTHTKSINMYAHPLDAYLPSLSKPLSCSSTLSHDNNLKHNRPFSNSWTCLNHEKGYKLLNVKPLLHCLHANFGRRCYKHARLFIDLQTLTQKYLNSGKSPVVINLSRKIGGQKIMRARRVDKIMWRHLMNVIFYLNYVNVVDSLLIILRPWLLINTMIHFSKSTPT